MTTIEADITATEITEAERLNFLPTHFGADMLAFENAICDFAQALCGDYRGGLWVFFELSNGGVYIAPRSPRELPVTVAENGFDRTLSADAAGIVLSIFALNVLAIRTRRAKYVFLLDMLKDYASQHRERAAIYSAID